MRTALVQSDPRGMVSEPISAPPPTGGLNARDSLLNMPPTDARVLINAIARPGEIEVRKGADDHATGMTEDIHTLMSYVPASGSAKMFAATQTEIYDVTAAGAVGAATNLETSAGPPPVYEVFSSGKWQYVNFANSADTWLICVNGADNMRVYNGSAWTTTATFTLGVGTLATNTLIDVTIYQKRLFFLKEASRLVYYLDAGAISGVCYPLDFEQHISKGGHIQAIGTWSVDAGDGLDDLFVAVTSEGEAIIYTGIDPSDPTTWALRGVYFVGRPLGQRCLFKMASELFIITERGIYPLSRALSEGAQKRDSYLTDKVNQVFVQYSKPIRSSDLASALFGWQAVVSTVDNVLVVNTPLRSDYSTQLVMDLTTGGWSSFKGWNATCWHFFNGNLYFAYEAAANVWRVAKAFAGYADFNGTDYVKAYISPAYTSFGRGVPQKHIKLFRPLFKSGTKFEYKVGVSSDAMSERPLTTLIGEIPGGTSLWNSAVWSTTYVWNGIDNVTKNWHSVDSYPGTYVSLYLEIENTGKTSVRLLGIDYLLGKGSIL